MEEICKQIKSGEIRDEENVQQTSEAFAQCVLAALQQPQDSVVQQVQECMLLMLDYTEFTTCAFASQTCPPENHLALACARAHVCDNAHELISLATWSLRIYSANRSPKHIAMWAAILSYPKASPTLLKLCLECLGAVAHEQTSATAMSLLTSKLLPLHLIQGKLSPTQSLLEAFHRELTLCVAKLCQATEGSAAAAWDLCIQQLTSTLYPAQNEGNSPKEVLILHELETLLDMCPTAVSSKSRACVCTRLLSCISSLHGMVCERALTFWQSDRIFALLQQDEGLLSKMCDGALAKANLEHWSPTVRSMAGAALLKGKPDNANTSSSPLMGKAMENAKQSQLARQIVPETMPLPKAYTSTSVIRDALEPFASGAFGVIWKGRAIVPGVGKAQWPLLALKEVDSTAVALREIEAMSRIGPHINLVQLLGTFTTAKSSMHLVLELVEGPGDLHTVVCDRQTLSLELTRWFGAQLGNAIKHIHSKGYVFGDVKPENVLVTNQGLVKLCDFGSCFLATKERGIGGTIEYLAPEQLPGFPGDWWAFGCVLHFMLTGKPPVFFNTEEETDLPNAFARAVTFADQRGGVHIKDQTCRSLVASLCARDATQRPTDGGESHAFFNVVRPWSTLAEQRISEFPGLPEAFHKSRDSANGSSSPWQRRTFSTIHSPLPKQYKQGLDASLLSKAVIVAQSSSVSSQLGEDWSAHAARAQVLFETALTAIPKHRIACSPSPDLLQQDGRDDLHGGGKIRRVIKKSYNVGGLDLSAG